jgi:hypothetical protein
MPSQCDLVLATALTKTFDYHYVWHLPQRPSGNIVHNGIYSAQLLIWMMMNQRLQAGGTARPKRRAVGVGRIPAGAESIYTIVNTPFIKEMASDMSA